MGRTRERRLDRGEGRLCRLRGIHDPAACRRFFPSGERQAWGRVDTRGKLGRITDTQVSDQEGSLTTFPHFWIAIPQPKTVEPLNDRLKSGPRRTASTSKAERATGNSSSAGMSRCARFRRSAAGHL